MNRFIVFILVSAVSISLNAQSPSERVIHNSVDKYKVLTAVHAGAGQMAFTELIGRQALTTNFLYLHSGSIYAKGGIGHHFHHTIEEMYVLLDGEAEFTVNGRTSKLKGPVVVPCKMGDAHAIYNPTGKPLPWLNFAVSKTKAKGDAFDLGDNRVGATLDPVPVFVSGQLKRDALKPGTQPNLGSGVLYRRVLGPDVFSSNWDHVDHIVIPPGSSAGSLLNGMEEVYYVMKGSGKISIGTGSAAVKSDDAFPGFLFENLTISNDGKEDLELLVIGISAVKSMSSAPRTAMVLQMDFVVPAENKEAFEKMYASIYLPAMIVQKGYLGSKLLRLFPDDLAKSISAEATPYNYSIQFSFDTEENRKKWVASDQHQIAWPAASKLAKEYKWRGYDAVGEDMK